MSTQVRSSAPVDSPVAYQTVTEAVVVIRCQCASSRPPIGTLSQLRTDIDHDRAFAVIVPQDQPIVATTMNRDTPDLPSRSAVEPSAVCTPTGFILDVVKHVVDSVP